MMRRVTEILADVLAVVAGFGIAAGLMMLGWMLGALIATLLL